MNSLLPAGCRVFIILIKYNAHIYWFISYKIIILLDPNLCVKLMCIVSDNLNQYSKTLFAIQLIISNLFLDYRMAHVYNNFNPIGPFNEEGRPLGMCNCGRWLDSNEPIQPCPNVISGEAAGLTFVWINIRIVQCMYTFCLK